MSSTNVGDRLDSWKEIAAYLKRDERTVQRWENERGLPVHRLEGKRRDVVIAYTAEIDAWLGGHSKLNGHNHNQGAEGTSPGAEIAQRRPFSRRVRGLTLVLGAGLIVAIATWQVWTRIPGEPDHFEVKGNKLTVFDRQDRKVWDYRFEFPLAEGLYRRGDGDSWPRRELALLRDIDGDGHVEFLFVTYPEQLADHDRAYFACFDHRGRLRWRYKPNRTVRFGDTAYARHRVIFFRFSAAEGNARSHIWLVTIDMLDFPSSVVKLDAGGKVLAEYWHAGHIDLLCDGKLARRRVLLVAAFNNERSEAAISVLDYDNPAGRSPAENMSYLCTDCPHAYPLAYFLFPASVLGRAVDIRPAVYEIRPRADGVDFSVNVGSLPSGGQAEEHYTLDETLHLRSAEPGGGYQYIYDDLRDRGRIKKPFDSKAELQRMRRIRYWDGHHFTTVPPSGILKQR